MSLLRFNGLCIALYNNNVIIGYSKKHINPFNIPRSANQLHFIIRRFFPRTISNGAMSESRNEEILIETADVTTCLNEFHLLGQTYKRFDEIKQCDDRTSRRDRPLNTSLCRGRRLITKFCGL